MVGARGEWRSTSFRSANFSLRSGTGFLWCENCCRFGAVEPPDQAASNDEQNRNQLRSGHDTAEDFAASGIVAQELDEIAFDSVEDHETGPHLAIEFLASEEPGKEQEVEELGSGFDELSGLDTDTQWSSADVVRQLIGESDSPEMIGGLAITATGGEAAKASEDVAESEAGSEAVDGTQGRHVMTTDVPGGSEQAGDQAAGKYASGLQGVQAEDFAPVVGVGAPVVDDVENFRANDSGENDEDAEIPGVVSVDTLFFGVTDADPKADENARGDEHAISRQIEIANMKKSGKHVSLDAPNCELSSKRESSRKGKIRCAISR